MLAAGFLFPLEESEVIPIVIQHNKSVGRGIWVYVDFHKLNAACVHDPFPTPFNDKIMNHIERKEAYSFMDGFSGYR